MVLSASGVCAAVPLRLEASPEGAAVSERGDDKASLWNTRGHASLGVFGLIGGWLGGKLCGPCF